MTTTDSDVFDHAFRKLTKKNELYSDSERAIQNLVESLAPPTELPTDAESNSKHVSNEISKDSHPTYEAAPDNTEAQQDFESIPTNPITPGPITISHLHGKTKPVPPDSKLGRFQNLGIVGEGATGVVYRVRDTDLNRQMVLKALRPDRMHDRTAVARFLEEAQLTSQLHHPGIVPVHELGILPDGRLYFTMREVRGRTLSAVITESHAKFEEVPVEERDWHTHFHGLITIFSRVCEPVAYAHSRGIIHRDLKPSNIMVGDFGEVQIIDWGLAKIIGDDESIFDDEQPDELTSIRGSLSGYDTLRGSIIGTPAFMPPEQARGALEDMGPRSDVYSLGAILAMVLDGAPPFSGTNAATILFQVIEGLQHTPGQKTKAPKDLIELCQRAMSTGPAKRPADATAFADAILKWRDGSNRRKRAFALIDSADELRPRFEDLRHQAKKLRRESRHMLQKLSPAAPLDKKRPAWSLQEEAEILEREASVHKASVIKSLETALSLVPNMVEAHERLVEIYRHDHAEAERRRDLPLADSLEVFIRSHNTGEFDDYLAGLGNLSLHTSPPGARVKIFRYIQRDRQRIPGLERLFGHTPIANANLPMGSYLLEIEASGRVPVKYPVFIGRRETWTGSPPGFSGPFHVYLPFIGEIDDDEIYVPASSFWRGGDVQATNSPPRSVQWLDPFVIQKQPVSHKDYLRFLNDLIDNGHSTEAELHSPKSNTAKAYGEEIEIYERPDSGYFHPPTDASPDFLNLPVNLISWHSARAYARWYSEYTGKKWRLPRSDEWEKAARGVGGRFFPWGDFLDPTWCCMVNSRLDGQGPVAVDAYPEDISSYGMHGAAGNIRDWVLPDGVHELDTIDDQTPVPYRGGCWFSTNDLCRIATREFAHAGSRSQGTGIRLARDYQP